MEEFRLRNGLDLALSSRVASKMASIQCWVGVGSMHELAGQAGFAHFLEHMLFKGTAKRSCDEISGALESLGGDFNAYTSFASTVYQIEVPSESYVDALEILSDVLFSSQISGADVEQEKLVVLEEIGRANDSPGFLVGKHIFETIFQGTEAERPITGTTKEIENLCGASLRGFYREWYVPDNMHLVVVGHLDSESVYREVNRLFGSQSYHKAPQYSLPRVNLNSEAKVVVTQAAYSQPRLEIAFSAPPSGDPDSCLFDLVAFCLGSGDSSRLSRNLRDCEGLVTSIGASVFSEFFGGVFQISCFTKVEMILKVVEGVGCQLRQFLERPITADELAKARGVLRLEKARRAETVSGIASFIGQNFHAGSRSFSDIIFEAILDNFNSSHIVSAFDRWVTLQAPVISVLVPEGTKLGKEEVLQAYLRGVLPVTKRTFPKPNVRPRTALSLDVSTLDYSEGLRTLIHHKKDSSLFNLVASAEGGLRGDNELPGLQNACSDMVGFGPKSMKYSSFLDLTEGSGNILQGFSGKDSFGIQLQCLTENADELLRVGLESLSNPALRSEHWDLVQAEIREGLIANADSAAGLGLAALQSKVFGRHPYRYTPLGEDKVVGALFPSDLRSAIGGLVNERRWVISVVSGLPTDEVEKKLAAALSGWCPRGAKLAFTGPEPQVSKAEDCFIPLEREQSHVFIGVPGLAWDDPDRVFLDVLVMILAGSGGRLFSRLRDQEGLAYSVSPLISYGCDGGLVGAYLACAPGKASYAIKRLGEELVHCSESVSQAEVERAVTMLLSNNYSDLDLSDSLAMTLSLMETYGYGYDDCVKYLGLLKGVSPEGVLRVAKKVFLDQEHHRVAVGPDAGVF